MIIGLEGFGSIWSVRLGPNGERAAFYNTTGISTNGKLRHRSRVFGQLRFNRTGGFNPAHVERNIGRTFECRKHPEPGNRSLLLHHLSNAPAIPDYFVFAVTSGRMGAVQLDHSGWKSDGVALISLSQFRDEQEALLLMPPHSWVRGSLGLFVAEPDADRPWRACLEWRG